MLRSGPGLCRPNHSNQSKLRREFSQHPQIAYYKVHKYFIASITSKQLIIPPAYFSVMLAAKFFDDQYFNNAYYAKVGGVPANEMNTLEVSNPPQ